MTTARAEQILLCIDRAMRISHSGARFTLYSFRQAVQQEYELDDLPARSMCHATLDSLGDRIYEWPDGVWELVEAEPMKVELPKPKLRRGIIERLKGDWT